jgi:ATP-dependent phosphoenolpyruvate carboxykinase
VLDETTKDDVWWGKVNTPLDPKSFKLHEEKVVDYLNLRP